jgi:hypothetical protein
VTFQLQTEPSCAKALVAKTDTKLMAMSARRKFLNIGVPLFRPYGRIMVIQSKQGMLHSHPVTPDFYSSSGSLSVFLLPL